MATATGQIKPITLVLDFGAVSVYSQKTAALLDEEKTLALQQSYSFNCQMFYKLLKHLMISLAFIVTAFIIG